MKYLQVNLTLNSWLPKGHIASKVNGALGWLLIVFLSIGNAWAATLKAGVVKVDITPPPGVSLWGFSDRKSPATGTLDPLYARVLVVEAGDKRVALISVDLGRP